MYGDGDNIGVVSEPVLTASPECVGVGLPLEIQVTDEGQFTTTPSPGQSRSLPVASTAARGSAARCRCQLHSDPIRSECTCRHGRERLGRRRPRPRPRPSLSGKHWRRRAQESPTQSATVLLLQVCLHVKLNSTKIERKSNQNRTIGFFDQNRAKIEQNAIRDSDVHF